MKTNDFDHNWSMIGQGAGLIMLGYLGQDATYMAAGCIITGCFILVRVIFVQGQSLFNTFKKNW